MSGYMNIALPYNPRRVWRLSRQCGWVDPRGCEQSNYIINPAPPSAPAFVVPDESPTGLSFRLNNHGITLHRTYTAIITATQKHTEPSTEHRAPSLEPSHRAITIAAAPHPEYPLAGRSSGALIHRADIIATRWVIRD